MKYQQPDVVLLKEDLDRALAALPLAERQLVTAAAQGLADDLPNAGPLCGLEILAAIGRLLNEASERRS